MIIQPAQRMRHIEEYYFSTKLREIDRMRAAGKEVLNLGIGSPDLPPPVRVIEELNRQSRIGQNHAYQSYRGLPELRQAFADWYARYYWVKLDPQTEILPLIGSKEGIMHIAMAFLDADSEALVP
ncbi:MAG: aminotransferase class I/II-fold pyridoxal phosphate-dependent enzyme, partial [Phaeodactylibacter sp.]|nr:aminotransferase class I/II-fold pyridoxal phosphate-dependent enzyme [Phaeodactylibacter sp.]